MMPACVAIRPCVRMQATCVCRLSAYAGYVCTPAVYVFRLYLAGHARACCHQAVRAHAGHPKRRRRVERSKGKEMRDGGSRRRRVPTHKEKEARGRGSDARMATACSCLHCGARPHADALTDEQERMQMAGRRSRAASAAKEDDGSHPYARGEDSG